MFCVGIPLLGSYHVLMKRFKKHKYETVSTEWNDERAKTTLKRGVFTKWDI